MVKGIAKHAVIVKSPDMKQFEQAIFILSPQEPEGVKTADEMLTLACSLASQYSAKTLGTTKLGKLTSPFFYFAAGSAATIAMWWVFGLLI